MRVESSVSSVSWIPSEAVTGLNKAIFDSGMTHYDDPPPDSITDLDALCEEDRFRFANRLVAWAEVEDGQIVDAGFTDTSGIVMGSTTVRLGSRGTSFAAVPFADIRPEPEVHEDVVRFVQSVGGHTALPAPRRVNHPPFVKFEPPTVWTTLELELHADGESSFALTGASTFPRHWVYDAAGKLAAKAGLTNFKDWWRHAFGRHTPWGDQDTPALVTEVETALERDLSTRVMRGRGKPKIKKVKSGGLLTEQGQQAQDVYLLLDGVLEVEVDGEVLAQLGPGAILGERAVLEGGIRTATLRAITPVRVALAPADLVDPEVLIELSASHRREENRPE